MNKTELKTLLDKANISEDTYTFNGGLPFSKICFEDLNGEFHVYYSERGVRHYEKIFANESDACEYMYNMLLQDTSTRKH